MPGEPPRRLLFVINDLARAGAETQLVELALRLDPRRFDRRIVLLKERNDFADRLSASGIEVLPLRRRGWWDIRMPWRLWRVIRAWRPDVVHSFLFLSNAVTAPVARAAGVPTLILSQRCSYEATVPPRWRRIARWTHRLADRVVVNSRAALEEERRAGARADTTMHIPNGVDVPEDGPPTRASLGLPEGPLVVAVGQLEEIKGHRYLVEAWPEVVRAHPAARLVLVGDGPRRLALQEQARGLGVDGSVVFLGFRPDGRRYAAAADVVVQPSLTEGMPNAVLEAMAAKRSVVATRVGGVPDLIEDGETGRLVPPADARALAAAIAGLLADRTERLRLGGAARARVGREFSVEVVRRAFETLYLSGGGAPEASLHRSSPAAPKSTGPTITP
ncbi:MAG TPA: glycosyltransferase [Vicinamibacteria bacterium]|nr:glycosyltransferase [Vicinamibacteria bacterium]